MIDWVGGSVSAWKLAIAKIRRVFSFLRAESGIKG